MRVIFMGSPDFAVPTLDALAAAGHEVAAAYTQPPRPAGRGKGMKATPVAERARALGIEVRSPQSLKSAEEQAAFAALSADVAVVAAYGLILPQAILDAPRLGCVNIHASLLPRWRGAAPVHRAILAGDAVTGVTIMQMEAGLDTGPMLLRHEVPIGRKNAKQLTEELGKIGSKLMVDYLAEPGRYPPVAQPEEGVTYAAKIRKDEARIDWTRPAAEIERQVRAFAPSPGAWFEANGERIKLLGANCNEDRSGRPGEVVDACLTIACGEGEIRPLLVQRAGKAPMIPGELLRGFPIAPGSVLP